MLLSRRAFTQLAAASTLAAAAKPNSRFQGVQIGAITYSFRALPGGAKETLQYCLDCNISAIELMSNAAESFAGAPALPQGRPTPDQMDARRKAAAEVSQWRQSASMDKFKEFRKMYNDAGIDIYAFKLPPTPTMPDAEYEYIWNVAETLGANHITMEIPTDDAHLARVAQFAAKRKLNIAFHTHGQGGSSGFDKVLNASPYTALNFDVGHYFGVNGESPVPLIEKYASRISSLHLKDRKAPANGQGGPNMPWGQGETPLKQILQTLKRNQYKFPASIEYEYTTPEGSTVLDEMKKCVRYCQDALA
ncbi:MAG: sugar phosphate isomerase/epimerase [Acidobacteria bacterium]|nr:sugar phosphate isomerase/epimerase [Acidobacteriota bacterium]